jgi:hypothetical protein
MQLAAKEAHMRPIIPEVLLACALLIPAQAAKSEGTVEPERTVPAPSVAPRTGKERLGDKASDEQRVNDCRVPPERRTRERSATCPRDGGS